MNPASVCMQQQLLSNMNMLGTQPEHDSYAAKPLSCSLLPNSAVGADMPSDTNIWLRQIHYSYTRIITTHCLQEMKKIGVGISGDAHKLHRDFGVQCVGLVCLSEEANVRLCSSANGRMPQKWSLAGKHTSQVSFMGSCSMCLLPPRVRYVQWLSSSLYEVLVWQPAHQQVFVRFVCLFVVCLVCFFGFCPSPFMFLRT